MPPITLLASQCPTIPTAGAMVSKTAIYGGSGSPPVSYGLLTGDTALLGPKFNSNAAGADLVGEYGGGAYAVARGLVISAGTWPNVNVTAGQAMIRGVVEVPSNTTRSVPDSHPSATDRVWIWLLQNGTLQTSVGGASTTPPAGAICLIGSCTTAGGAITSVDTSGVMYLLGGYLVRYTADIGMPADTPPATLTFIAYTAGGCAYLWTGMRYERLWEPLMPSQDTLSATDVQDIPVGQQKQIFGRLRIAGHIRIEGRLRVTT